MGYSVKRSGIRGFDEFAYWFVQDMINYGCEVFYDSRGDSDKLNMTVLSTDEIDKITKINHKMPWIFSLDNQSFEDSRTKRKSMGRFIISTPYMWDHRNEQWFEDSYPHPTDIKKNIKYVPGEICGMFDNDVLSTAYPLTYYLSITDRGFALNVSRTGDPRGRGMFWICVQRLVNIKTGEILGSTLETSAASANFVTYEGNTIQDIGGTYSPVVCTYFSEITFGRDYNNIIKSEKNEGNSPKFFVVRDLETIVPTRHFPDTIHTVVDDNTDYTAKLFNYHKQIAYDEHASTFHVYFPKNVSTIRNMYPDDRFDLIAYTSANLVPEDSIISLKFGETNTYRKYKATKCSGGDNWRYDGNLEGMRLLQLWEHGGIEEFGIVGDRVQSPTWNIEKEDSFALLKEDNYQLLLEDNSR